MTVSGPYRGLSPFAEEDAPYFFGRDTDRRLIVANLIASPLTLLYAPSGVGKTSVLLAGVSPDIRRLERDDERPEFTPVVVRDWSGDALAAIADALEAATEGRAAGRNGSHLAERLERTAAATQTTLLLLLDQFEEFVLYHGEAWAPGEVASELTRVMTARDLPVRVLLGMREDSLAMLDRFKGRVPHLFANYLRLEHLDREAARQAIMRPLDTWNATHPDDVWEADADLAEAVIEEVGGGRVELGWTGGGRAGDAARRHVETAFLQLVMTRLWEEERARGSHRLQTATLRKLGGAAELVRTHLDRRMRSLTRRQRNLAAEAFHQLVTPSGTKVAQSAGDLAEYAGAAPGDVTRMLETLSKGEWWIVRRVEGTGGPRYEIFHDVLAEAVLDWRARHAERRRRARLIRIGLAALLAVAVAVAFAVEYERRAQTARAEQLAATARERLGSEPVEAVRAAAEAVDTRATDSIRATLRMALLQAEAEGIGRLRGGRGPVTSFRVSGDARRIATARESGRVELWTLANGSVRTFDAPQTTSLAFSPDGSRVAAAGRTDEILVFGDGRTPLRLAVGEPSRFVRWSPRGDLLLIGQSDGAMLWDLEESTRTDLGGGGGGQFSPGGTRVATSTKDGLVRVWSLAGDELATLPGTGEVRAMAFTPRGSRVLAARDDGAVNVLNARGCGPGQDDAVEVGPAAFSADGFRVGFTTPGGVSVVDIKTCERSFLPTPLAAPATDLALSADGSTVVAPAPDGAARVWDVPSGTLVATLIGDWRGDAEIGVSRATRGGDTVLTAGDRGGVQSWWLASLPAARLDARGGKPFAVAFGGNRSVVAATDAGVRTTDLASAERPRFVGDRLETRRAAFSGDGTVVAVAGEDGHLWARRTSGGSWVDLGDAAEPTHLAVDADGKRIASTHRRSVTRIWDTAGRKRIGTVRRPRREHVTAFASDELVVVDDQVAVHDLPQGDRRALASPVLASGVPADVPVVAARGSVVAAAQKGGPVTVRDLEADAVPVRLASARRVRGLAVAPSGAVVASAGDDGLRLWDAKSGQHLIMLAARPFETVAFSPDGRWVVAGASRSGAEVFRCDACGSDSAVREAADEFLRQRRPIEIASRPEPRKDVPLALADFDVQRGGFASPLPGDETEDLSDAPPPPAPAGDESAPVPTATPQAEPMPLVPTSTAIPPEEFDESTGQVID